MLDVLTLFNTSREPDGAVADLMGTFRAGLVVLTMGEEGTLAVGAIVGCRTRPPATAHFTRRIPIGGNQVTNLLEI